MRDALIMCQLSAKNIYNQNSGLNSFFEKTSLRQARVRKGTETELIVVPDIQSDLGKCAFSYRGPNHWNKLARIITMIKSKTTFKISISKINNCDVDQPT